MAVSDLKLSHIDTSNTERETANWSLFQHVPDDLTSEKMEVGRSEIEFEMSEGGVIFKKSMKRNFDGHTGIITGSTS